MTSTTGAPFFIYAQAQYDLVRESRKVLIDYCKSITPIDFINEHSSFGRGGSVRNLLVHIANTYEFWIANGALKKNIPFTPYYSFPTINESIALFGTVDILMSEFLELFKNPELIQIDYEINGVSNSVSPFKLFTHVITHEFHHKGQILSLSRHLGYTPVDTDVMR